VLLGSEIAALLEILADEKWHLLAELQEQIGMAAYKMQRITAFLSMFGFAVVDETNERVKISKIFKNFWRERDLDGGSTVF
jgi:DNA-binding IclR family transcriptional regulator